MVVDPLILRMLDALCRERENQQYNESFTAAEALLKSFGETDLANRLYAAIPDAVSWELIADLFNILIWETSDNGAALTRTTEGWLLDGSDERKMLIALHLDVYPFIDADQMDEVLTKLAAENDKFSARCTHLISSRPRGR